MYASWPTKDTSHRRRGALVVGFAVLSHWFFDAIVHIPDLPLAGDDSTKVGLGLWDNVVATYALEFGLLAIGAWIYAHTKTRRHPLRVNRLVILLGVIALLGVSNLFAPPPTDMRVVASVAILMYPGLAWLASWTDRDPPPQPAAEQHNPKHHSKAA